jgi:hypothetical protein
MWANIVFFYFNQRRLTLPGLPDGFPIVPDVQPRQFFCPLPQEASSPDREAAALLGSHIMRLYVICSKSYRFDLVRPDKEQKQGPDSVLKSFSQEGSVHKTFE